MKSILFLIISSLNGIVYSQSYKMGEYITCWEQNMEDPEGFKDPAYYYETCEYEQAICDLYASEPNANEGDVCDHTDPDTGNVRDVCYFNTIFGEEVNLEKTWSYKCWDSSKCPLGDGVMGCKVQRKRINCCCATDYCNGDDLLRTFATYGTAENYPGDPPDLDALCDLDFGEWTVVFEVEGYEDCGNAAAGIGDLLILDKVLDVETNETIKTTDGEGEPILISSPSTAAPTTVAPTKSPSTVAAMGESMNNSFSTEGGWLDIPPPLSDQLPLPESGFYAHSGFMPQLRDPETMGDVANSADILLIFTYFILSVVCVSIGCCIGMKWKESVMVQQMVKEQSQQLDL